jgi:chromosome segregation ATPase
MAVEELRKKITECQEKLGHIEEAVIMVKNQVNSERKHPPADPGELEKRYRKSSTELEDIQKEIDSWKLKAKDLKSQITAMKQEFELSPAENKPENWAKLSSQIKPLGSQIVECESAISSLEMRKFAAEQAKEMALISLEAFKQKLHEKPLEEDPRLKAVLKERNTLAGQLERAEAELRKLQEKGIFTTIKRIAQQIYRTIKSWFRFGDR